MPTLTSLFLAKQLGEGCELPFLNLLPLSLEPLKRISSFYLSHTTTRAYLKQWAIEFNYHYQEEKVLYVICHSWVVIVGGGAEKSVILFQWQDLIKRTRFAVCSWEGMHRRWVFALTMKRSLLDRCCHGRSRGLQEHRSGNEEFGHFLIIRPQQLHFYFFNKIRKM